MNKKNLRRKGEKGITLVALIITIILLLILAVVAIRAVSNDGIIGHAKNAQTGYEKAQGEEQSKLSQYEYELAYQSAKLAGTTTAKNVEEYILETVYGVKMGDYVNYNPQTGALKTSYTSESTKTGHTNNQIFNLSDYTGGWQVLGVENGKLKLISSNIIKPSEGGVQPTGSIHKYYSLNGETGYINGIEELNNVSTLYGQGKYAETARSVNMDDLKKLSEGFYIGSEGVTDYGKKEGPIGAYGIEVTYGIENGKLVYRGNNGAILDNIDPNKFYYCDSKTKECLTYNDIKDMDANKQQGYKITNTLVGYSPRSYFENKVSSEEELKALLYSKNWYNLLYYNAGATNNPDTTRQEAYWLATERNYANPKGYASYGFLHVSRTRNLGQFFNKTNRRWKYNRLKIRLFWN